MKVIIRTIAKTAARRTIIAEGKVEDGAWIDAAERVYNAARGGEGEDKKFLIVDQYLGGGFAIPFGLHSVQFARYSKHARAYSVDEIVRLEVIRDDD